MSDLAATGKGNGGISNDNAPEITVIIPTRNESKNILPLLTQLSNALKGFVIEVVFVDDSTDDTPKVLSAVKDEYDFPIRVNVRSQEERNGLSGAVVDGFGAATGEWVCVIDADLQHPPQTIVDMWEQAKRTGADIVVGSRSGDLFGPAGLSRLRSLNSKILTIIARSLFPRRLKNVSDPLTGLFLVRRKNVDVDALRPDGFKILLEILVRNPALQASEVHFHFAPRHSGESKADVREGARFFRHLITLRSTVNPHLGRFIILAILTLLGNGALFALLVTRIVLAPGLLALLSAELSWLIVFFALELWVFSEREGSDRRRRFWGYFLLTQIVVFLVHLPLFYLMHSLFNVRAILANVLAFAGSGLARYLLSEQWTWTRSAMIWQPQSYFYNLHDLLRIESHIPLRELDHFTADYSPSEVDIQIRVDRLGTPTHLPGGISYDDQLGRFGFGITVLPGDYTQIIVSPLLEQSPDFLFTNVVEPVLRWRLVLLGYAMVKSACIAKGDQALLISSEQDLGLVVSRLCVQHQFAFLADDLMIIDTTGKAYCYPKPLTVDQSMLESSAAISSKRYAHIGQRLLYTHPVRQIGLWLSDRDLPVATLNTYLQRFVPQLKYDLLALFPNIVLQDTASLAQMIRLTDDMVEDFDSEEMIAHLQQSEEVAGFQPHPLLAEKLRSWDQQDLLAIERQIIEQAIDGLPVYELSADLTEWWSNRLVDQEKGQEGERVLPSRTGKDEANDPLSQSHGEP